MMSNQGKSHIVPFQVVKRLFRENMVDFVWSRFVKKFV